MTSFKIGEDWTGLYTNWKGERRLRTICPLSLRYGVSDYHPVPGWLVSAVAEDGKLKDFSLAGFEPEVQSETSKSRFMRSWAVARIVRWHVTENPDIECVYRCDGEATGDSTILLVETNRETLELGVIPISFPPCVEVPYTVRIIELSPFEWESVQSGSLELPPGWVQRHLVYQRD